MSYLRHNITTLWEVDARNTRTNTSFPTTGRPRTSRLCHIWHLRVPLTSRWGRKVSANKAVV